MIVALETLTLPLYVLVGLRRREVASAVASVIAFNDSKAVFSISFNCSSIRTSVF